MKTINLKNINIKIYLTHICNYNCWYCDGVKELRNNESIKNRSPYINEGSII